VDPFFVVARGVDGTRRAKIFNVWKRWVNILFNTISSFSAWVRMAARTTSTHRPSPCHRNEYVRKELGKEAFVSERRQRGIGHGDQPKALRCLTNMKFELSFTEN
jgi:hypothetical protein